MSRILLALALVSVSSPAFGKADVTVSVSVPAGVHVYESGAYAATVRNIGNQAAAAVSLEVQLPETHTSPTKYILGDLGTIDSRCAVSGTKLVCGLGKMNKKAVTAVGFTIALPYSAAPLVFSAKVATSSAENTKANNAAQQTASPLTYALAVSGPASATNLHCTGTGLTSFYECALFPSSISSHDATFEAGGAITFADAPATFTGAWWQPAADRLVFEYYDNGALAATFDGRGVDGACFEGLTTFPASAYVSPYRVCLL